LAQKKSDIPSENKFGELIEASKIKGFAKLSAKSMFVQVRVTSEIEKVDFRMGRENGSKQNS